MPCISSHLACMYVCLYLCVCVRHLCMCMHAPFVRMCVYVGQTEGGMVVGLSTRLASDWKTNKVIAVRGTRLKRCAPCAFRNSFESLVSDTREGASSWDWPVHLTGASV